MAVNPKTEMKTERKEDMKNDNRVEKERQGKWIDREKGTQTISNTILTLPNDRKKWSKNERVNYSKTT